MASVNDEHDDARAGLEQALFDLRLSYHRALIRRLRGTELPAQELRSWVLEDASDARVFARVRAQQRGSGTGIMTRIGRFMVRLRWPWST